MEKTTKEKIEELESKLTGEFMNDMDIKDQIHTIQMKAKGVSCEFGAGGSDCEACGS